MGLVDVVFHGEHPEDIKCRIRENISYCMSLKMLVKKNAINVKY